MMSWTKYWCKSAIEQRIPLGQGKLVTYLGFALLSGYWFFRRYFGDLVSFFVMPWKGQQNSLLLYWPYCSALFYMLL